MGKSLLPKCASPTWDQMLMAVDALEPICHVEAINFITPNIVIELEVDGTTSIHTGALPTDY